MDEFTTQELIEGCRKNDRKCQKRLYQEFFSYAMQTCIRYAEDKEQAIELVNDGFLKVFTHIGKYDRSKKFKPWLGTIMINTAIDYYRKQIKRIEMEELNANHELGDKENILSGINYQDLIVLVQQLTLAYRTVFNLFVIDGFSHEEIASMLSISVGTSKSNLFKAREQLKKMLASESKRQMIKRA